MSIGVWESQAVCWQMQMGKGRWIAREREGKGKQRGEETVAGVPSELYFFRH